MTHTDDSSEGMPQPNGAAQEGPTDWERAALLTRRLESGMEAVTAARLALPLADDARWSSWVEEVDSALERAQTRLLAVEYALKGAPIWGWQSTWQTDPAPGLGHYAEQQLAAEEAQDTPSYVEGEAYLDYLES